MVVLAASLVSKSGKALVSRQFVDMSRIRIEGLLAAFPKLVNSGKQHTYVETENVRYVYQPMEGMYLLLVTNKASNILEDLETLRLLSKVVPDYVQPLDEEAVCRGAFDLLFAFDEVISLGHKENVTVAQVKQNTEMESHEERLHKMIIQSKINETKDVMKRKAMEIDKSKVERSREGLAPSFVPAAAPSISTARPVDMDTPSFNRPDPFASGGMLLAGPSKGAGKGMQLGKAKKGASDFLDSLRAEGESIQEATEARAGAGRGPAASAASAPAPPAEPVVILVAEKVMVALNKDGGVRDMEVQGSMSLQVLAEESACIVVDIRSGANTGYQFKTHPNIDKQMYSNDNRLGLKDPDRPFPTGSPLGILKWRMQTQAESSVPLLINCWPSASGSESYVNIEYECTVDFDLHNVAIVIPIPSTGSAPRINSVDGDYQYNARSNQLTWTVDLIDSANRSGALEFVVPVASSDAFFPVDVSFSAAHTLCQVVVTAVTSAQSSLPVKYGYSSNMITEGYEVS